MKKNLTKFWICSLSIFVLSCGKLSQKFDRIDGSSTSVSFQTTGADFGSYASQNGGMMIYLVRSDGAYARSLKLSTEEDLKAVSVPNGTYRIFAVSWDGSAPGNMTGTTRCARANGGGTVDLLGAPTLVNLDLATSVCQFSSATNEFADISHGAGSNMSMTELYFCTNTNPASGGCTTASPYNGSIKLVLLEYERVGETYSLNRGASLASNCYSVSTGTVAAPGPRLPSGEALVAGVEAYSDGSCGTLARTYSFRKGLRNPSASPGSLYSSINMAVDFEIYLYKDF